MPRFGGVGQGESKVRPDPAKPLPVGLKKDRTKPPTGDLGDCDLSNLTVDIAALEKLQGLPAGFLSRVKKARKKKKAK